MKYIKRSWIADSKLNFGLFQPFDRYVDDREDDYNPDWKNYCQEDELQRLIEVLGKEEYSVSESFNAGMFRKNIVR